MTPEIIIDFVAVSDEQTTGEGTTDSATVFRQKAENEYRGLEVRASFGQGRASSVPWIGFLGYGQSITRGIYPAFLYYKEFHLLILSYAVSNTNVPDRPWPNAEDLESIAERLAPLSQDGSIKYGESYVYKAYDTSEVLDGQQIFNDLNDLLDLYAATFARFPENKDDDVEGIEHDPDGSWGKDYPIDTMLIRNENRTVHDVLRRIQKGTFVMDPDFQRDFIWSDEKQSKLIESVLMRIPLPVFYLAEDREGRMIVVDGLQRLSTFRRFAEGGLMLRLKDQKELDKKRFSQLSPKLQNRIEDCNLVLYVIDAKVPERARLDIFERVNGGVPLTRQQMRNCLFMGKATQFLKAETLTETFIEATGKSLRSDTMRDREFVNRFCAFSILPLAEYKGDMDEFLAQALTRMNDSSDQYMESLSVKFRTGLRNNFKVFDKYAFRKHRRNEYGRSVINASIWDVFSTGLAKYPHDEVAKYVTELNEGFFELMNNFQFEHAVTYSTNDSKQVRKRFELGWEMLKEVLGDPPN